MVVRIFFGLKMKVADQKEEECLEGDMFWKSSW